MSLNLQSSIVLITSSDEKNRRFGTGFVIRQSSSASYILTCAHVIRDVGGAEQTRLEGLPATLVASGENEGIDLAILKVQGLSNRPVLTLQVGGNKGQTFKTAGFQAFGQDRLLSPLQGCLGDSVELQSQQQSGERLSAWVLQIAEDYALQPGYSGSPVVDEAEGVVIGIVSHRQGESKGIAISINALDRIWRLPNQTELFQALQTLGYRDHDLLFSDLSASEAIAAACLIQGLPEYCPCWLLNRLLLKYVDPCMRGRVVKVKLTRRTRKIGVEAIWRELGGWAGIPERIPAKIAEQICQWWQTQDVILIFHAVDFLPESEFSKLIHDFWDLLATKAMDPIRKGHPNKLLMFLIDYEEAIEGWEDTFVEEIDSDWNARTPIRFPEFYKFSYNDILDWIRYEFNSLPKEFRKKSKHIARQIFDESEEGIPEDAFDIICDLSGWNWYEESETWLQRVS